MHLYCTKHVVSHFFIYSGYSVIALLWYTILWLKYVSYISVNKWLREGSMSNPPPLYPPNDADGKVVFNEIQYVL